MPDAYTTKAFPYGRPWEREQRPRAKVIRPRRAPRCIDREDDQPVDFGTGDGDACGGRSYVSDPSCRGFVPICGMSKVGAMVRAQGGGAAWALNVVPTTTKYFLPRAVRAIVLDGADHLLLRRVFVTGVAINNFPQESVHTVPALAGTTAGWFTDDWVAPDGYAVPVRWGVFSIAALIEQLTINGWNHFAGGITCDIAISIYGHPFSDSENPGCEVGRPMPEAAKDRFVARLRAKQVGSSAAT